MSNQEDGVSRLRRLNLSLPLQRGGPSRLIDAGSANQFEQNTRAYHVMNHFLGSIIDHVSAAAHTLNDFDMFVEHKHDLDYFVQTSSLSLSCVLLTSGTR